MDKQGLTFLIILFFVFVAAVLIFASQTKDSSGGFETVSVAEAREMIEKGEVFVLDVRTPAEFNASYIEGATLIPLENGYGSNLGPDRLLEARVNEVPKGEKILVYCRTGRRSASASRILVDAGHSEVYNMAGGINAWIDAAYPVVSSAEK